MYHLNHMNHKINSNTFGKHALRKMELARTELYKAKSPIPLRMVASLIKKSISQAHRQIKKAKNSFKYIFLERVEKGSPLKNIIK